MAKPAKPDSIEERAEDWVGVYVIVWLLTGVRKGSRGMFGASYNAEAAAKRAARMLK